MQCTYSACGSHICVPCDAAKCCAEVSGTDLRWLCQTHRATVARKEETFRWNWVEGSLALAALEQNHVVDGDEQLDDSGLGGSLISLNEPPSPLNDTAICTACHGHQTDFEHLVTCDACNRSCHAACCDIPISTEEILSREWWACDGCLIELDEGEFAVLGDEFGDEQEFAVLDDEFGDEQEAEEQGVGRQYTAEGDAADGQSGDHISHGPRAAIRLRPYDINELSCLDITSPHLVAGRLSQAEIPHRLRVFELVFRGVICLCIAWTNDQSQPMRRAQRIALKHWSEEQWWHFVLTSHSEARRIVLGGYFLSAHIRELHNLPPIGPEEPRQWLIYENLPTRGSNPDPVAAYTGSATNSDGAWMRLREYAKYLIRKIRGFATSAQEDASAHLRYIRTAGIDSHFRVLAAPSTLLGSARAIVLEGMWAMLTAALRRYVYTDTYTEEVEQSWLAVTPTVLKGLQHVGLNHAHQFTQSVRFTEIDYELFGGYRPIAALNAHEQTIRRWLGEGVAMKNCPCCHRDRTYPILRNWVKNRIGDLIDNPFICFACMAHWRRISMSARDFVAHRRTVSVVVRDSSWLIVHCLLRVAVSRSWSSAITSDAFASHLASTRERPADSRSSSMPPTARNGQENVPTTTLWQFST